MARRRLRVARRGRSELHRLLASRLLNLGRLARRRGTWVSRWAEPADSPRPPTGDCREVAPARLAPLRGMPVLWGPLVDSSTEEVSATWAKRLLRRARREQAPPTNPAGTSRVGLASPAQPVGTVAPPVMDTVRGPCCGGASIRFQPSLRQALQARKNAEQMASRRVGVQVPVPLASMSGEALAASVGRGRPPTDAGPEGRGASHSAAWPRLSSPGPGSLDRSAFKSLRGARRPRTMAGRLSQSPGPLELMGGAFDTARTPTPDEPGK